MVVFVGLLLAIFLSRLEAFSRPPVKVTIVGGGLSGLCAAIEALERGANVVLLEQEALLGGNSRLASSGLNGAGTEAQKNAGIDDNEALFFEDTRKSGRGQDQEELVRALVRHSRDAISFLERQGGLNLSIVTMLGGQQRARTHRAFFGSGRPTNVGLAIISAMEKRVRSFPNAEIRNVTRVAKLLTSSDGLRVTGVKLESGETLLSDAVILATGGYSTDRDGLIAEYTPELRGMPSTNAVWKSAGDGVRFGRQLGAQLQLMKNVCFFRGVLCVFFIFFPRFRFKFTQLGWLTLQNRALLLSFWLEKLFAETVEFSFLLKENDLSTNLDTEIIFLLQFLKVHWFWIMLFVNIENQSNKHALKREIFFQQKKKKNVGRLAKALLFLVARLLRPFSWLLTTWQLQNLPRLFSFTHSKN